MKKPKTFDCVAMKNAIQAEMLKRQEGLSEEEIHRRRHEWLATSQDPIARKWRSLGAKARVAAGAP